MRLPWQRARPAPGAPVVQRADAAPDAPAAESRAGWAFLPPLQRTVGSDQLTSAPMAFLAALPTRARPMLTGPMSHVVSPAAPGGLLDGDGGRLGAPTMRSSDVDLALVPPAPARPAVAVQRHSAGALARLDAPPAGLPLLRTVSLEPEPGPASEPVPEPVPEPAPEIAEAVVAPEAPAPPAAASSAAATTVQRSRAAAPTVQPPTADTAYTGGGATFVSLPVRPPAGRPASTTPGPVAPSVQRRVGLGAPLAPGESVARPAPHAPQVDHAARPVTPTAGLPDRTPAVVPEPATSAPEPDRHVVQRSTAPAHPAATEPAATEPAATEPAATEPAATERANRAQVDPSPTPTAVDLPSTTPPLADLAPTIQRATDAATTRPAAGPAPLASPVDLAVPGRPTADPAPVAPAVDGAAVPAVDPAPVAPPVDLAVPPRPTVDPSPAAPPTADVGAPAAAASTGAPSAPASAPTSAPGPDRTTGTITGMPTGAPEAGGRPGAQGLTPHSPPAPLLPVVARTVTQRDGATAAADVTAAPPTASPGAPAAAGTAPIVQRAVGILGGVAATSLEPPAATGRRAAPSTSAPMSLPTAPSSADAAVPVSPFPADVLGVHDSTAAAGSAPTAPDPGTGGPLLPLRTTVDLVPAATDATPSAAAGTGIAAGPGIGARARATVLQRAPLLSGVGLPLRTTALLSPSASGVPRRPAPTVPDRFTVLQRTVETSTTAGARRVTSDPGAPAAGVDGPHALATAASPAALMRPVPVQRAGELDVARPVQRSGELDVARRLQRARELDVARPVQRAPQEDAPEPETSPPPTTVQTLVEPPTVQTAEPPAQPAPGPAAPAAAVASPFAAASAADLDELARRLAAPLLRRVRGQLLVDRERRGVRVDL